MSRRALLLDLDGTLVDSLPDLAAATNRLLEELGRPTLPEAAIATMVGDGTTKLVERALAATGDRGGGERPTSGPQAATNGPTSGPHEATDRLTPGPAPAPLERRVARFLELYAARATERTRPYPGVPETLAALKAEGWGLAVVTNKPIQFTKIVLEDTGLASFFSVVIGGDSFPRQKPDPGPLRAALGALAAAEGVMVGDHQNDMIAAQAAGIPGIFAAYGYGAPGEARPAATIARFADLPAALRSLSRSSRDTS